MTQVSRAVPGGSELKQALSACRGALLGVGAMTAVLNVLTLTGSFYMLEIYDRVIPSRSLPTLVGLTIIVAFVFAFQGLIDLLRNRILVRLGASVDEAISARIYSTIVNLPLKLRSSGDGLQPLRDLDQIRSFVSSAGPAALFDLPWMPLYLGICYLFHPLIGLAAFVGVIVLVILTIMTDVRSRGPAAEAAKLAGQRAVLAEASRRNAEVLRAMGMTGRVGSTWQKVNESYLETQQAATDVAGGLGAVSKVFRMFLQSAVLGLGAYLVINQEATAGVIIASSILTARALAPVELAIANWKGFISARQSWRRVGELLARFPAEQTSLALPRPAAQLSVEGVTVVPPGDNRVVVQDMSFQLRSGSAVGIIGPSGCGKSSLARAIVGVWQPVRGKVRLDGAALEQWSPESLGRHIGYLPQDVELFAGTVAQNIARFEEDAKADDIIAAATAAGVHDLILRLPSGYETQIGEAGTSLSAGQRQRLALARALYGNPFLVVLDEPNSNLDASGEEALTSAIAGVRARGGAVVIVAHRPSALAAVDLVLMMNEGKAQAFGPRDEVLSKVMRPAPPLKVVES